MTDSVTLSERADPRLADTVRDEREEAAGGIEHARVKSLVRDALFGRGGQPVRIGRFTILRQLGSGGMGIVYTAFDDELERKVAIKLLRPDAGAPAGAAARLRREAQAVARLSHPNVIPVFEVGEHHGEVYVAMEFVRGVTLREFLEPPSATEGPIDRQPRSWTEVRDVLVQAGRGLQAAHEAGIVHRDFKPENVMVGEDGRVRVLDFGVASVGQADAPSSSADDGEVEAPPSSTSALTAEGSLLGTPAYMAPEALRGEKVGPAADQFSFCATAFEAFFGRKAFEAKTVPELLAKIEEQPPTIPGDKAVPSPVRQALLRGLRPQPNERFESMAALLSELDHNPAAGRRLALLALGGVVVLGSMGATLWAAIQENECPDPETALAGVWNPQRRAQAQTALIEADPPVALRTWDRAARAIDQYAARWSEAQIQTCTLARGGDEARLQSQLCLQWALSDLQSITDALRLAETKAAATAPQKIEALFDPRSCLDEEARQQLSSDRALRSKPPPAGSEAGLVSDFESEPWVRYGTGWASSTDSIIGGDSKVVFEVVEGGANDSAHALRIKGTVSSSAPAKWAGVMLFPGDGPFSPANLQSKRTFSFWARGDPGPHTVMLFTSRSGFEPAMQTFDVDETWSRHDFDLDTLDPDRFDVTGIFIGSSQDGDFDLRIDDVAFE